MIVIHPSSGPGSTCIYTNGWRTCLSTALLRSKHDRVSTQSFCTVEIRNHLSRRHGESSSRGQKWCQVNEGEAELNYG